MISSISDNVLIMIDRLRSIIKFIFDKAIMLYFNINYPMPRFKQSNRSLLSRMLTEDLYFKLRDKKDNTGYSFRQLIKAGISDDHAQIGVYAGSLDSYYCFSPLLDKIILEYH